MDARLCIPKSFHLLRFVYHVMSLRWINMNLFLTKPKPNTSKETLNNEERYVILYWYVCHFILICVSAQHLGGKSVGRLLSLILANTASAEGCEDTSITPCAKWVICCYLKMAWFYFQNNFVGVLCLKQRHQEKRHKLPGAWLVGNHCLLNLVSIGFIG